MIMKNEAFYAVLIAFCLNIVMSPIVIPFLRRLKFGQNVRDDGPSSHLKKSGTPTMGGIIILASMTLTSLIFMPGNKSLQTILFVTLGFGLIGFLDDYIKIVKKRSLGLTPMQKIIGQLIVTLIFAYLLYAYVGVDTSIILPFTDGKVFDSSVERGQPVEFKLNQVIKGWTEGLQLVKKGGKIELVIPPELAYGKQGAGDSIPPDATLYFDVEVLDVNPKK